MTIEHVLVCDDIEGLAESWVEEIKRNIDPKTVRRLAEPADAFAKLLSRVPKEGADAPDMPEEATEFDAANVLVVDYDLLNIGGDRARHTGEEFARMARLYSDCDFIIVMNQFDEQASFDLEMTGHLNSFADLNIGSQLVGADTLWGADRDGSKFAPWYWPDIEATIEARRGLIDIVVDRLDDSLFDVLGFPAEMATGLSDRAAGFILSSATNIEEMSSITVRDFLMKSIEHKEIVRAIKSDPRRAAGFAVSRFWKWYARAVVGPQDLLVDVPHLLQRLPFVMKPDIGDPKDIATWNLAIASGGDAVVDALAPARFEGDPRWLGGDAFWWPKVLELPDLIELRNSFDPDNYADVVFAEDASAFIPFDKATPFRAGFYNQYDVRYLAYFKGVSYAPGRRLAAV